MWHAYRWYNDFEAIVNYTLEAIFIESQQRLVESEQSALSTLFTQCCSSGGCNSWKLQNANNIGGHGGIKTDFCSFPGQMCAPTGDSTYSSMSQART